MFWLGIYVAVSVDWEGDVSTSSTDYFDLSGIVMAVDGALLCRQMR